MSAPAVASAGVPSGSVRKAADSAGVAPGAGDAPTDLFQDLMQALSAVADTGHLASAGEPTAFASAFAGAEDTLQPAGSTDIPALLPDFLGLGLAFAQSLPPLPPGVQPTVNDTAQGTALSLGDLMANATQPAGGGAASGPPSPIQLLPEQVPGQIPSALTTAPSAVAADVPTTLAALNQRPPAHEPGVLNPPAAAEPVTGKMAHPGGSAALDTAARNEGAALDPAPQPPGHVTAHIVASTRPVSLDAAGNPGIYRNTLPLQPTSPAFPTELVSEVRFLIKGGLQHAELRMNPVELGPIQIELRLNTHVADIGFSAAHATTRESIAQSLPQLREMLSSQGLTMGQTSVGAEAQNQQQAQQERVRPNNAARPNGDEAGRVSISVRGDGVTLTAHRVLDLYA